jgi:DNA-binding SARP family transcriptional activator/tetratricopeptide (TPR) repeat protein
MVAIRFSLLGDIQVRVDGGPIALGHVRQRTVLAALLVEANRPVPTDVLLDRVWGGCPPQRPRAALYGYLSRIRHPLAAAGVRLVRRSDGYVLPVDPMTVDLHRFEQLVDRARTGTDPAATLGLFDEALALWDGEVLTAMDTPWANAVRESLNAQRHAATLDRNDLALRLGHHVQLLAALRAGVREHPLDERLAGQLMLALYRCGQPAGALECFERLRRDLTAELGAHPGPAVRELHRRILTGDPALNPPPAGAPTMGPAVAGRRSDGPHQLPAAPLGFTGRCVQLAAVDAALGGTAAPTNGMPICVISGAGGMGKTWLALRWAAAHLDRFPDGQIHVNLRGFDPAGAPIPPDSAVRALLDAFDVPASAIPADPQAQAALYRSLIAGRRILIVLDNARDSDQVVPLLPGTAGCAVLVTSRHRLTGLVIAHGARSVTLDALTGPESRALLAARLGDGRMAAEPDAVDRLLRYCAGLPLALGIVAARVTTEPDVPLAAMADELATAARRLDALDVGETVGDLRAVLACSTRALAAQEARVFGHLGVADGPDVSLEALASLTALPAAAARRAVRELANAHLVTEHGPGRYRTHDLVRLYAAEQVDPAGRPAAVRRQLDHHLHTAAAAARVVEPYRDPVALAPPAAGVVVDPPTDPERAWAWFTAERPNLLAAVTRAARSEAGGHAWRLAWYLAYFLEQRGYWADLVATNEVALAATDDPLGRANAHRGIARGHTWLGRFDEARDHLRQALDLFGRLGDDTGRGHVHRALARVSARQGRPADAVTHDLLALDLFRAAGHDFGQANVLNSLGWHHAHLGDLARAVAYCEQALAIQRATDDRIGQALTWDSLGYAHHRLGRRERAITCYETALALFRRTDNRYLEATVLTRLGDVHDRAGDVAKARAEWRMSADILAALGHPDARGVEAKLTPGLHRDPSLSDHDRNVSIP